MDVLCCQHDIDWEAKSANFERVSTLLDAADPQPGTLLILPEMFATGFSMNSAALAEDPGTGPSFLFLADLARRFNCPILAGVLVRDNEVLTNEAVLIARDGSLDGRYAKMHPFAFAGESDTIAAGGGVATFTLPEGKVAPFVCYDLRFPEVFRATDPGCALYVVIANWPKVRVKHWRALLRARAIENQAFVVGVNRVGRDPKVTYSGHSMIINPMGEVLAEGDDEETTLAAELDLAAAHRWREEFPAQQDRRSFSLSPSA